MNSCLILALNISCCRETRFPTRWPTAVICWVLENVLRNLIGLNTDKAE